MCKTVEFGGKGCAAAIAAQASGVRCKHTQLSSSAGKTPRAHTRASISLRPTTNPARYKPVIVSCGCFSGATPCRARVLIAKTVSARVDQLRTASLGAKITPRKHLVARRAADISPGDSRQRVGAAQRRQAGEQAASAQRAAQLAQAAAAMASPSSSRAGGGGSAAATTSMAPLPKTVATERNQVRRQARDCARPVPMGMRTHACRRACIAAAKPLASLLLLSHNPCTLRLSST